MSTHAALEQALDDLAAGRAPSAEGQGRAFLNCVVENSRTRLISVIQARARECPLLGVKQTSISSDLMSAFSQMRKLVSPHPDPNLSVYWRVIRAEGLLLHQRPPIEWFGLGIAALGVVMCRGTGAARRRPRRMTCQNICPFSPSCFWAGYS